MRRTAYAFVVIAFVAAIFALLVGVIRGDRIIAGTGATLLASLIALSAWIWKRELR